MSYPTVLAHLEQIRETWQSGEQSCDELLSAHLDDVIQRVGCSPLIPQLFGKEQFERLLEQAIVHRPDSEIFVFLGDIDQFKLVNTLLTHATANIVLQAVGEGLRTICDKCECTGFHLSGDEFALISIDQEVEVVRHSLESWSSSVVVSLPKLFEVSLTFGYSRADTHDDVPQDVVGRADGALTAAKLSHKRILGHQELREEYIVQDERASCGTCGATVSIMLLKGKVAEVDRAIRMCPNCGESAFARRTDCPPRFLYQ